MPLYVSCYGKKENAEAADSSSTYKAYLDLMKNAQIEIFFVAPEDNPKVMKKLANEFKVVERNAEIDISSLNKVILAKNQATESDDINSDNIIDIFDSIANYNRLTAEKIHKRISCISKSVYWRHSPFILYIYFIF